MIFIGIGANLNSPEHGAPLQTCEAAVHALTNSGLRVMEQSNWYESAPVPVSDQPWFINGVVRVETDLDAPGLMHLLHTIEDDFGRVRVKRNEARVLDMDLLCYDEMVMRVADGAGPVVPHPRMTARAFVLKPMAELAPDWHHPITGQRIKALIDALPADQVARPLSLAGGLPDTRQA